MMVAERDSCKEHVCFNSTMAANKWYAVIAGMGPPGVYNDM